MVEFDRGQIELGGWLTIGWFGFFLWLQFRGEAKEKKKEKLKEKDQQPNTMNNDINASTVITE